MNFNHSMALSKVPSTQTGTQYEVMCEPMRSGENAFGYTKIHLICPVSIIKGYRFQIK